MLYYNGNHCTGYIGALEIHNFVLIPEKILQEHLIALLLFFRGRNLKQPFIRNLDRGSPLLNFENILCTPIKNVCHIRVSIINDLK